MGRGPKRKVAEVMSPQAMRQPAPDRSAVAASHYEEHLGKVGSTLDHVASLVAAEIGADPSRIKKYVAGAGLVGLAGAFLTPVAPVAATAFAAFAAYKSWKNSGAWFQTNIGRSLAQHFGYDPESGRLRSIAGNLVRKGLGALGGAAAGAVAFGTPLLPVAGLAMGGFVAYKAARVWMSKRKLDQMAEKGSSQASSDGTSPEETTSSPETANNDQTDKQKTDRERPYDEEDIENAKKAWERRQRKLEREATMADRRRARRRESRTRRAEKKLADKLLGLPQGIANEIAAESTEHTRKDIRDDLRHENVKADRDFSEEVSDEAIEARMIILAAGSQEVDFNSEEGQEIARLTYELEKKRLAESLKTLEDASKKNQSSRDQAMKSLDKQEAEIKKQVRKEVKEELGPQIAEVKAQQKELQRLRNRVAEELASPPNMPPGDLARYQEELQTRAAAYTSQLEQIDKALGSVQETEDHYVEARFKERYEGAFAEERERIQKSYESNARRLEMQKNARESELIGRIDGLANLTVAAGRTLACGRCGTKPKSVRVRCSKCGMPFVIEKQYRDYIGDSDDDLRRKGKLDLVEKYEGSAETREILWNKAREGKRIRTFKDSEGSSKGSSSGSGKKSSGSGKKGAAQKAADYSSSEPSIVSPVELHKDMQPDGEFNRQQYLDARKKSRGDSRVVLCGLNRQRIGTDKMTQVEAIREGRLGWDWNKSVTAIPEAGDTVLFRENGKNRIGFSATAAEVFSVTIPTFDEIDADPEAYQKTIDETWDRISPNIDQEYYPKEHFEEWMKNSAPNATKQAQVHFTRPADIQDLDYERQGDEMIGPQGNRFLAHPDESQISCNTVTAKGEPAGDRISEETIDRILSLHEEKAADLIEQNGGAYPGEGFGLDREGNPQVCGVKTSDGHPCRRPARPRTQYCWQHQGGPRKGESALSQEEIVASQEALQKSWETDHSEAAQSSPQERSESGSRIPIGRKKAEEFINGANGDPAKSDTFEKCGMTERELAQYANAYLEACNPKPGETVAVCVSHEAQRPLAEVIESLARERRMEPEVFYPDANNEEQLAKLNKLEQEGKLIVGFLDQVGAMEEGIPGTAFGGGARWNVTMTPTRGWAALLAEHHEITGFPEDEEEAFAQLVEDLQSFTYSDRGVSGTRDHLEELERRAEKMNDLGIQEVTISSPEIAGPGTDTNLRMKMLKESRWMTVDIPIGTENPEGRDDDIQCNTATEEYWGTPDPDSLEGNFTSSAPLALERAGENPIVAEQVRGVFENGQLVSLDAYKQNEQGEWVKDETTQQEMERFFFGERGRPKDKEGNPAPFPQCGELGVVDSENRVAATGRHYLTPMIDEHGGIHLAIGDSYEANGGGKDNGGSHTGDGTIWEETHIDVRIGSMETTLRGKTKDGSFIDVIKNGVSVI